ncbi:IclR family transcriptional regulator [Anoxynatronum sibiricum]|uniref:IclR family transcriptional regulator n=2 Tax=Anoxynatronum sibiricum TaxID=210623 RepID=A0ABU9VQB0_9CLOT
MRDDHMSNGSIQSVLKALQMLDLFAIAPGWNMTDISKELNYPTSTTHRLLLTLEEAGYIHRDVQSKMYYLTIKPYLIGSKTEIVNMLEKLALASIRELAQNLNESVNVSIALGLNAVTVLKADAERQFSAVPHVGDKRQLHATSVGKCLLAYNSNGCYDHLMKSSELLKSYTPNTIIEKKAIEKMGETIRYQGFATDHEEVEVGLTCIGAPIFDQLGNCIAAVSVSMPTFRITDKEAVISQVIKTAGKISSKFKF